MVTFRKARKLPRFLSRFLYLTLPPKKGKTVRKKIIHKNTAVCGVGFSLKLDHRETLLVVARMWKILGDASN